MSHLVLWVVVLALHWSSFSLTCQIFTLHRTLGMICLSCFGSTNCMTLLSTHPATAVMKYLFKSIVLRDGSLNYKITTGTFCLDTIPGHRSAFSSYPARLYSGDDFYILSSNMVSIKCTIFCVLFNIHVSTAWFRLPWKQLLATQMINYGRM